MLVSSLDPAAQKMWIIGDPSKRLVRRISHCQGPYDRRHKVFAACGVVCSTALSAVAASVATGNRELKWLELVALVAMALAVMLYSVKVIRVERTRRVVKRLRDQGKIVAATSHAYRLFVQTEPEHTLAYRKQGIDGRLLQFMSFARVAARRDGVPGMDDSWFLRRDFVNEWGALKKLHIYETSTSQNESEREINSVEWQLRNELTAMIARTEVTCKRGMDEISKLRDLYRVSGAPIP